MLIRILFHLFSIIATISVLVFVIRIIITHFVGSFKLYYNLMSCSIFATFFTDFSALLFIFACLVSTENPIPSIVVGVAIEVFCVNMMYKIISTHPLSMFRTATVMKRFYQGMALFTADIVLNEDGKFRKITYCPVCNHRETAVSPTEFRCSRCGLHMKLDVV